MEEKGFFRLQTLTINFLFYLLFFSGSAGLLLFTSNSGYKVFTIISLCLMLVALLIIIQRYLLKRKLSDILSKREAVLEFVLHLVFFMLLLVWHLSVNTEVISEKTVENLQKFAAPFILTLFLALFAFSAVLNKKAGYFQQIESKKRYPDSKLIQKIKPYYFEFATKRQRAERFNKGLLIELYSIIFLLLLSGKSIYGIIILFAFLPYFFIFNRFRLSQTQILKGKKRAFFFAEGIIISAFCAGMVIFGGNALFDGIFRFINGKDGVYTMKLFPLFIALLFMIPSIVIRNKLKRHFKDLEEKENDELNRQNNPGLIIDLSNENVDIISKNSEITVTSENIETDIANENIESEDKDKKNKSKNDFNDLINP